MNNRNISKKKGIDVGVTTPKSPRERVFPPLFHCLFFCWALENLGSSWTYLRQISVLCVVRVGLSDTQHLQHKRNILLDLSVPRADFCNHSQQFCREPQRSLSRVRYIRRGFSGGRDLLGNRSEHVLMIHSIPVQMVEMVCKYFILLDNLPQFV